MIAFEISRNGQVLAVVGRHDLIGLNAVLMACGDLNGCNGDTLFVNMTALGCARGPTENTTMHHTWSIASAEGSFDVGDTLSIRIIRTEFPTPPTTSEELENEEAELGAARNGGPVAPVDNLSVDQGPSSVS
ncbi:hypothetical protein ACXR0O_08230 [Verrucomicrobiota bacterium sgz303538]